LTNNIPQREHGRLRTEGAADYIGVATSTLEKDRVTGFLGVPFIKIGRTVVYDTADLDEYLASRRRHSTSEAPEERCSKRHRAGQGRDLAVRRKSIREWNTPYIRFLPRNRKHWLVCAGSAWLSVSASFRV